MSFKINKNIAFWGLFSKFSYINLLKISIMYIIIFILPTNLINQEPDESAFIAAYLERFTRFIENKSHPSFDNSAQDFHFYIYGNSTITKKFESIFQSQKIKSRNVKIKFINKIDEISNANMLFITKSGEKDLDKIISAAANSGILTTSYSTGFAKKGVHINLFMQDQKLKFEINNNSARQAGFNISHLLLSKAIIIE